LLVFAGKLVSVLKRLRSSFDEIPQRLLAN